MYKYSSSLSKAQFNALLVVPIVAKCSPFGVNIKTPPGPVEKIFPDECTFKPSNHPSDDLISSEPSKNIPLFSNPFSVISNFVIIGYSTSELFT